MTQRSPLKVRHIDFQFGDDIPFHWNPGHVPWGNFVNMVSLAAPAFERYFMRAIREVVPRITDPALAKEADEFCRQEAQHSKHHANHLKMLLRKHPGLEEVSLEVKRSYDAVFERESIEFHLAYAATAELLFGPVAKFVVEQRECLFRGANPTITSFMLWHLIEEFEHRNSALDIYEHVVGGYAFRMRCFPRIFRHLQEIGDILLHGLAANAPASPEGISAGEVGLFHADVPMWARGSLVYELASTLLPLHDPNRLAQPEWVTRWLADESAGVDMRTYYPGAA